MIDLFTEADTLTRTAAGLFLNARTRAGLLGFIEMLRQALTSNQKR